MKELFEKHRVKKKGLKTVIEELKQRMLAKSTKVKRYQQRLEQFRQNRVFDLDQKKIFAELNRNEIRSNDAPNAEEYRKFWSNIWVLEKGITGRQNGRMIGKERGKMTSVLNSRDSEHIC